MPDCILAILMAMIEFGHDGAKGAQIFAASGYAAGTFHRVQLGLIASGWAQRHPYGNCWWITERGKIAVAIETGRRSRARAEHRMQTYPRQKVREFACAGA